MSDNDKNHSEEQAKAQLASIIELVQALRVANEADDGSSDKAINDATQAINDDPLSVEVRSDWHTPGSGNHGAAEACILLCTGGPAVRLIIQLDDMCEPEAATIEHQDWGTPWTALRITAAEEQAILEYARCFYFAED